MTGEEQSEIAFETSVEPATPVALPEFVTPEQLAAHLGWSPRELRKMARKIGACRILGNAMILIQDDVDAIMEATRPAPRISPADASNARPKGKPLAPGNDLENARLRLRQAKERDKRKGAQRQP